MIHSKESVYCDTTCLTGSYTAIQYHLLHFQKEPSVSRFSPYVLTHLVPFVPSSKTMHKLSTNQDAHVAIGTISVDTLQKINLLAIIWGNEWSIDSSGSFGSSKHTFGVLLLNLVCFSSLSEVKLIIEAVRPFISVIKIGVSANVGRGRYWGIL